MNFFCLFIFKQVQRENAEAVNRIRAGKLHEATAIREVKHFTHKFTPARAATVPRVNAFMYNYQSVKSLSSRGFLATESVDFVAEFFLLVFLDN